MPDALAGVGAQRHDGVREEVVAQPLAAEVVVAGAAGRHEDEIARGIGDDHRPGVGAAGAGGAAVLPRVGAEGRRILRDRIPGPFQLAGDRVEAAHFAARMRLRRAVGDGRADDDGVADDGRRRGDLVVGKAGRADAQSLAEIDGALVAEARNGLPGSGVERDQARVDGRDEDAALAAALPRGDAAAREIAVALVARRPCASNAQRCWPVTGSSAMTRPTGVLR